MTVSCGRRGRGRHDAEPWQLRGEWVQALLRAESPAAPQRFCADHGLPPDALREPLCRVSIADVAATLRRFAGLHDDPLTAMRLAARGRPRDLFYYLMAAQPRLGDALAQLARFGDLLLTHGTIELEHRGHDVALLLWPSAPEVYRPVTEAVLTTLYLNLRELSAGPLPGARLHLRGRAPAPAPRYREIVDCETRFEQEQTSLSIDAALLDLPMRRRNAHVAACLERMATVELRIQTSPTVGERVRLIVRAGFDEGERHGRDAVARRLVCSPRTLQQALESEGTSFRSIEDEIRRELAVELVTATGMTQLAIAEQLGFADKSFARAFRRWAGCSPTALRRRELGARSVDGRLERTGADLLAAASATRRSTPRRRRTT